MRIRLLAVVPVLAVALLAVARPATAGNELKGAAILDHPCGKAAVRHMGLVHAGKIEEATRLGTEAMQDEWKAMPADDRKMMSEMMKEMSQSEAQFSSDIEAHGVLVVEGKSATLTVTKPMKDGSGSGTETMTQRYALDGASCLISR